ncbi:integral membrane sensor signal transduction histidine kinase (plasmid) [Solidesulfovibrio carbinoliphilus subsp. oakridgensis]|jgi:signal transduction histidine kinase|uniref:histidine kinase n=2 Tax=Solidesulfovibrio TaxID=2910984 RepID=G7QEC5_9BACT|nr:MULTISPECIES: ATP-binding protein [Desulfovibrionaceae]EHJ45921.1 integral membrane sensor signal transduction histidine kinase [Solidesulfovibrio carbinoliphilus subsp. oakridgensis]EKO40615.1 MAG: histidine kinase [Solidesulfovibrio magneticus str. Maddingley MBC34]KHK00275.1 Sensory box histidine kinase/response regulator [Desulfovibrio sp. TomC]HML53227.1 ATP-binding protein [Solidesulfovibrio magneticus]
MNLKAIMIVGSIVVVTALHYGVAPSHPALHLLHRELYFIPILLAGFWFGLRVALLTSLAITVLYLPPILSGKMLHDTPATVIAQLIMFNVVALLMGLLEDRRAREQERLLGAEKMALLGRAAAAIGLEVKDVVVALRRLVREGGGFRNPGVEPDVQCEIDRLDHLLYALVRVIPSHQVPAISLDINDLVTASAARLESVAHKVGVKLMVENDPAGCRTRAVSEEFGGIIDALVKNAVEASPAGGIVTIATGRQGQFCLITVRDKGQGIPPEHIDKIFMPFFSTKPRGHGLTLASTKKFLKDIGGDITVESEPGKGAAFHLHIPRERAGDEPLMGFGA